MIHTALVQLPPADILDRAKVFFSERVPQMAAFVEKEGPTFLVLRGQGGEEVVFGVVPLEDGKGNRLRVSTLLFDQPVDRFLSTLPLQAAVEVH